MKKIIFSAIFSILSFFAFAQNRSGPVESQNYRGQRTVSEGNCSVSGISARNEGGMLVIDVRFSGAVDPRSFSGSSVLVNGKSCQGAKITFNREGNVARVQTGGILPCKITVQGVRTFDGKSVAPASRDCR